MARPKELDEDALEDALKGLEGEDISGPGGLPAQLAGRVVQTALGAELSKHLGQPPGGRRGVEQRPQRAGKVEDVSAWPSRALDRVDPIVYLDAMFVKIRGARSVRSRA